MLQSSLSVKLRGLREMKVFIILNFLLLLGVSLAFPSNEERQMIDGLIETIDDGVSQFMNSPRTEHKRFVRQTLLTPSGAFLPKLGHTIIRNCQTSEEKKDELQETFNDMKTCVTKKQILITPKDEYLANIDKCGAESVKQSKNCLPENERYYPDFLLEVSKSLSKLHYDDAEIIRNDLRSCAVKFYHYATKQSYINCLMRVAREVNDSSDLPSSKQEFCKKFLPVNYCFTNWIRDTCDDTSNIQKFRTDFINAVKAPCEDD